MMKKLFFLLGLLGAVVFVFKKVREASDDRALWHEATTTSDLQ